MSLILGIAVKEYLNIVLSNQTNKRMKIEVGADIIPL